MNGSRITAQRSAARGHGVSAPGSRVWQWQYNALGQPTQYTHPNNTRTEYGYDTRHRLTSIVHRKLSNNSVMESYALTLTDGGDISRVTHADGSKWDYYYDARGRLLFAFRKDSANTLMDGYGYTYDAGDNLTQQMHAGSASDTWVYGYNNANEQTSMTLNGGTPETRTYDAWGRLATRTQGTYSATYGYRYGGKQYSLTSNFPGEGNLTLQYRGDGRLYSRTDAAATTVYRYDRGWNPILEENSGGAVTAAQIYRPGMSRGEVLARCYSGALNTPAVEAYHDQLGSVRAWRLGTLAVQLDEFEPYGKVYSTNSIINLPPTFALHPFDPAAQAYRAPYRMYSPAMARWTTEDPLGMIDGPNVYGYVGNMPNMAIDPNGQYYWLLFKWGLFIDQLIAGLYNLDKCLECNENASRTNENARRCLDIEDYSDWLEHAKPGSECYYNCSRAATYLISTSLWKFIPYFIQRMALMR